MTPTSGRCDPDGSRKKSIDVFGYGHDIRYWQVQLDEESPLSPTAETISSRVCPLELTGAPASYQALMANFLRNILFSYALCYVDDLCMSDSPEKHCEHLTEIFDRFRQAKLCLNPNKCKFGLSRVVYLMSKDGISVDESKVSVIKTPPPKRSTTSVSLTPVSVLEEPPVIIGGSSRTSQIKTANLRSVLMREAKFFWNSAH